MQKDDKILFNYNGNKIIPIGYIDVKVEYKNNVSDLQLYVIFFFFL